MEDDAALRTALEAPDLRARIDALCREHEAALQREARLGARRAVVRDGLVLAARGGTWRSLWLLSHRALRRAGLRRHSASEALLAAWRGKGLVLLRAPGQRRSVELDAGDSVLVHVPADTPYDTLADETTWHLIVFHSHAAAALARSDATPDGWIDKPEEADS
jgi:hypothetical protein